MKKSLIALAVIAAGYFAADQAEIAPGATFEAPDDAADKLIGEGLAKPVDQAASKSTKVVKVRLLIASEHGKANDVRELPADVARTLVKAGEADDDKAAVAYAAGLPQNQKKT